MSTTVNTVPRSNDTSKHPADATRMWRIGIVLVAALICPFVATTDAGPRLLLAMMCMALFIYAWVMDAATGVVVVLSFLAILGGLRRWIIPVIGTTSSDPLLLVAPLIILAYTAQLFMSRQVKSTSILSKLLLTLLGVMIIQVFNPLQGGLAVGIGGAMFFTVPMLWYFAGRYLNIPDFGVRVIKAVLYIAIVAACYGLYQTWFGFNEGELEWMHSLGKYNALYVGSARRAFSFFTSPAEYSVFLGQALVVLWALWLCGNRTVAIWLPILALALFLESARGPIVYLLISCTALWAVQGKTKLSWAPRGVVALIVGVAGLGWGLTHVQDMALDSKTSSLVQHQADGLLDPANSTAPDHITLFANGVMAGFKHPLGYGLGAATLAARRFGGVGEVAPVKAVLGSDIGVGVGTEVDISNIFVSLGCVGGLIYLALIACSIKNAFDWWLKDRSVVSLCVIGILLYTLGQWLNGNYYAGSLVVWVLVGIMDRLRTTRAL